MATGGGLFGKTHARRDFIALGVPPSFLAAWEAWLQHGLARSRQDLGDDWTEVFLTAPIWFFWIGPEVCGTEAVGATMPSMDGVGRCFPLAVFAFAPEGRRLLGPPERAQGRWFEAAAGFLLGTLDEAATYEAMLVALRRLPPVAAGVAGTGLAGTASRWWTPGGAARAPDGFEVHGWPAPPLMTRMLGRPLAVADKGTGGRDGQ